MGEINLKPSTFDGYSTVITTTFMLVLLKVQDRHCTVSTVTFMLVLLNVHVNTESKTSKSI